MVDLGTTVQVATIVGEFAAAGALIGGFVLYTITKRDEYVDDLKATLATNRARCHRLNESVGFELIGEIVRAVVYSKDLELALADVYVFYFTPTTATPPSDLATFMDRQFPPITVSLHPPRVESFEGILIGIDADLARYQSEFPALYRVFVSVRSYLRNVQGTIKKSARDDEAWKRLLVSMHDGGERFQTLDHFKDKLANTVLAALSSGIAQNSQPRIDSALTLLDTVVDAYLAVPGRGLLRWGRVERSCQLTPLKETKTLTQDLREAEKALKQLLSQDDVLTCREMIARLEK